MAKMIHIGYLITEKKSPHWKEFSVQPITDADREAGFRMQKLYIDEEEQPK